MAARMPASHSESFGKIASAAQGPEQNGQQHPRAQEAGRQVPNVLEHPEIGAARVGEEQQHEADFGDLQQQLEVGLPVTHSGQAKKRHHPGAGEHNRRSHDGPFQPPGNQAEEENQSNKNGDEGHGSGVFEATRLVWRSTVPNRPSVCQGSPPPFRPSGGSWNRSI